MEQRKVAILLILYYVASSDSTDIFVRSNGTDTPPCIGGVVSCLTLGYVLSSLSNATCNATTSSVRIAIGYDHQIFPAYLPFQCEIALYIIGVDQATDTPTTVRTLTCGDANDGRISIHNAFSVYWEGIRLYGCAGPDVYGLSHVGFAGCRIEESGGMIVENTGSVNITQSTLSSARNIPSNRSFDSFFMITQANIHIGNSVFIGSSKGATALWIVNSVLRLEGAVTFVNSSGVLGGALRLTASRVIASGNVSVQFEDNHAQYGSAIYIDNTSCPLVSTEDGFLGVVFKQSAEMGSYQSYIYIANPNNLGSTCWPSPLTYHVSYDSKHTFARSPPNNLSISLSSDMTVFPGKDIFLDVNITDYFQNAASCEADISLSFANTSSAPCNDPQHQIELTCLFTTPQQTSSIALIPTNSMNTTIQIKTKATPEVTNVTINLSCKTSATSLISAVSFELQNCPSYYTTFSIVTGKCECLSSLHNEGTFVCSSGIACLAADHWIGQIESSNAPTADARQTGVVCCAEDAGMAIASHMRPRVKAVVIIVMLSREQMDIKILNSVGSGPIYSALFFLGFVGRIPFDTLSQYRALQDIVSAFRSVILPTLDIISEIPVCILPSSSSGFLYLTGLRYLGVASLVFILLIYNAMLCCWSRVANQLQTSPLKSICLLILWGYYLVVTTSIDILKANSLSELDEVRVAIQPELVYFRGVHLLLSLIAILLISLFAVPLTMILLLSQLLWKCIDLSRIKPFLDEFQHVYKDDARWFSSAYLILWVAIVAVSDQSNDSFTIYSLLLVAFCTLVCFVRPYKVKWLNYVDVALLVCMFTIASLFDQQLLQDRESVAITVFVYMLVMLPLVYFAVGLSVAVISRLKCQRCKRQDNNLETQLSNVDEPALHETALPPVRATDRAGWNARAGAANFKNYRESLLSELDDQ
ncbi:hypothetical protein EMCRGX_G022718 [Ephydatia muelleri]